MPSPIRLELGDRWAFEGLLLTFERELGGDLLQFRIERSGAPFQLQDETGYRLPDSAWAMEAYRSGKLRRLPALKGTVARRVAAEREYDPATIDQMDRDARRRVFVLRGLDELGLVKRSETQISYAIARLWSEQADKAAQFQKPHPRTVMRWLEDRGEAGRRSLGQMVSMTGRVPRASRYPQILHRAADRYAVLYWTRMGWSQADAYAVFASRIHRLNRWRERAGLQPLPMPSGEFFRSKIKKRDSRQAHAAKWGDKDAAARFKAVKGQLRASRFLAIGCMDSTSLDAIAAFDAVHMLPIGTPWLTAIIDVKTRCVVGFVLSFEPPSIYTVAECVKRAALPKKVYFDRKDESRGFDQIFGRFDHIIMDNGKEFSGITAEDGLTDLGTTFELAPIASPQHKAIVERFFRTLNTLVVHKLPGARLSIQRSRELGYNPLATAILTIEEIEDLIWEALRIYHLDVHTGTGFPPGLLWKRDAAAYGIPIYDDPSVLDKVLGVPMERQLSRSGILLNNLAYHAPALVGPLLEDLVFSAPVREQRNSGSAVCRVKVKYNPANLGAVHVYNHRRDVYVRLPCTEPDYAEGLSLWQHEQVQASAREEGLKFSSQRERLEARARLVAKAERLMPDAKQRQRRALVRMLRAPMVETAPSGVVEIEYAASRHDGLAPIIPQIALVSERTDGGIRPSRPARPKSPPKPATRRKPKGEEGAEPNAFAVISTSRSWDEFK
ncbi:MAG: Mu transposase C-terminal domain-containing protein [Brevundimonas aurantiaca]|jgi:putative transposase|uniref:Mu transposase C-terminal domain-containing protein n=1 Tax=Brevundimonas aurantiaca TaxID=74316 RepID=UPI0040343F23